MLEQKKLALNEALVYSRKRPKYQLKHHLKLLGEDESLIPGEEGEWKEFIARIEKPIETSGLKLTQGEVRRTTSRTRLTVSPKHRRLYKRLRANFNLHASFFSVGPTPHTKYKTPY